LPPAVIKLQGIAVLRRAKTGNKMRFLVAKGNPPVENTATGRMTIVRSRPLGILSGD
jgi:hypothetical protein